MRVSVIGGSDVDEETYDTARSLGQLLADAGHTVVCGGLTGVMEGVAEGVDDRGGQTIGILPGKYRAEANRYIDTAIATGLGSARNVLVVRNGDAVVAVDGKTGTLSEIAHALDLGRPVAGIDTHDISGVSAVETPEEAVEYVESSVAGE